MSKFNKYINDELINIQSILPFKINDRGIFNFEIFSNQNFFVNPNNMNIILNIFDLYYKKDINELRRCTFEGICSYWKKEVEIKEKRDEIFINKIKKWFEEFFLIKDVFYGNIGLSVFKLNLIANKVGIMINDNLNIKIKIKDKKDYVENEIKKNNLYFEKNSVFQIRNGENIIFYLSLN